MNSFQSGTSRMGQGLYPIIRRVRRPLMPVEALPEPEVPERDHARAPATGSQVPQCDERPQEKVDEQAQD